MSTVPASLRPEGSRGLRIDEALKERQLGEARFGDTKTDESDSYVPIPADLSREIAEWIAVHPQRDDPRAFLFLIEIFVIHSLPVYYPHVLKDLWVKASPSTYTYTYTYTST